MFGMDFFNVTMRIYELERTEMKFTFFIPNAQTSLTLYFWKKPRYRRTPTHTIKFPVPRRTPVTFHQSPIDCNPEET
jgi:hypothetical protein